MTERFYNKESLAVYQSDWGLVPVILIPSVKRISEVEFNINLGMYYTTYGLPKFALVHPEDLKEWAETAKKEKFDWSDP